MTGTQTETDEDHTTADAGARVSEQPPANHAHPEQPSSSSDDVEGLLKKIGDMEKEADRFKNTVNYALLQGLNASLKTTLNANGEVDLEVLAGKAENQKAKNAFYNTTAEAIRSLYKIGTTNELALGLAMDGILGFPLRGVLDNIMTGSDFNYADIFPQMIRAVNQKADEALASYTKGLANVSYVPGLARKAGIDPSRIKTDTMNSADVIRLSDYASGKRGSQGLKDEKWYQKEAA